MFKANGDYIYFNFYKFKNVSLKIEPKTLELTKSINTKYRVDSQSQNIILWFYSELFIIKNQPTSTKVTTYNADHTENSLYLKRIETNFLEMLFQGSFIIFQGGLVTISKYLDTSKRPEISKKRLVKIGPELFE